MGEVETTSIWEHGYLMLNTNKPGFLNYFVNYLLVFYLKKLSQKIFKF